MLAGWQKPYIFARFLLGCVLMCVMAYFLADQGYLAGFDLMLIMLAVMAPLVELDADTLAQSISELQLELETVRTGIAVTNRDIQAEIIKERCEAYILDKATAMGLTLEVEIQLSGDQTYPYPVGVTLRGQVSESERSTLSNMIAQELGIPEERQAWSTM